jgi:hypothetical protein
LTCIKEMKHLNVVLILILCSVFCDHMKCMGQKHFVFYAGYGYYELWNAGVALKYSEKSSIGAFYGTNFKNNDTKRKSLGLFYNRIYVKPIFWKIKPGFSFKAEYWTQDDLNYFFSNAAFIGSAALNYDLAPRLNLLFEGGGVFNYVIETDRKQNTVAGSPVRFNGNYCISLRYNLAKHE